MTDRNTATDLYVNRNNGNVIRFDEKRANLPEHLVPLSVSEVEEYYAWLKDLEAAREAGKPLPKAPLFGPLRFAEDRANVVAVIESEADTLEQMEAPAPALAKASIEDGDEAEALLGDLLGGEDS